MNFRHIAVVDIGKTNAKLVLIDRQQGCSISSVSLENLVVDLPPYPHYDTDALWEFVVGALSKLHAMHRVDGISIATHGAAAALIGDNALVLPVLDYEHLGPETTQYEPPDFTETYSPRLPAGLNLGAQLHWQSKIFSEAFGRATSILMYPQYWAWKLTGVIAGEVTSLGTHTDLWNPVTGKYSSLVRREGWRHLFPPLRAADSILGHVLPEVAKITGLPANTPVACGIHDSNASLLPYISAGRLSVISSGTWTIVMTIGGDIDYLDPARDCLANVDAFGRAAPTARFMGGREFELLMAENTATPTIDDIRAVISAAAFVLPGVMPGVGPFPNAKGGWVKANELNERESAAAIYLYLALMTEVCLNLTGCGEAIVLEGPLAKNELFAQILAALTDTPTFQSNDATGTSAGAAMLFGIENRTNWGKRVAPLKMDGLKDYATAWGLIAAAS